jgi:hypothetical protein
MNKKATSMGGDKKVARRNVSSLLNKTPSLREGVRGWGFDIKPA